jgi:hypothetical protein
MTYKQLFEYLKTLDREQMQMDVSIYDPTVDEYYPTVGFGITNETDVLDENHPFIILK